MTRIYLGTRYIFKLGRHYSVVDIVYKMKIIKD
jgi:hypothetical protein